MDAIVERVAGVPRWPAPRPVLVGAAHERARKETRAFGTVTPELLALREWLLAKGVTQIALEGTGIYWRPVYEVLEDGFDMILGNAHYIKNVPGRKTDVKDSEWLADLARHELIARSFVPPKPVRQLRELLRYRRKLVESRTTERNRLLKVLETANIKLASVASNVFGVSGRLMLQALLEGGATPAAMAALAQGRLRKKRAEVEQALEGRSTSTIASCGRCSGAGWTVSMLISPASTRGSTRPWSPAARSGRACSRSPGQWRRGRRDRGGAGARHERLSQRAARGGMGRGLSREQRKRR
jgi:transposase